MMRCCTPLAFPARAATTLRVHASAQRIHKTEPVVLDHHVLAFDVAGFIEALRNATALATEVSDDPAFTNPITGIAGCCARATSGHATAVPPSSVMNSRRLVYRERSIVRGDRG